MKKYRKKPVEVEALQWDGFNIVELYNFLENKNVSSKKDVKTEGKNFYVTYTLDGKFEGQYIKTLEGNMQVSINDYIIKGVQGEFYPCKPDIFEETYVAVE